MFQRMLKDPGLRVFLIHLIGFVVIVGAAAAFNLYATPDRIWFVWLLAGWGIALAAHGLALLLRNTRRRERIFIDPKARNFAVQLFAYVAVMLLLFAVNYLRTPNVWWFYWVALGWGAGVVAQAWCIFYKHRRARPDRDRTKAITAKRSAAGKSPRSKRKARARRG
jgi:hypothetical protein